MIEDLPSAIDLEQAAAERGWSVNKLCREADVDRSIFQRFKTGKNIQTANLQKLIDALKQ